MPKFLEANDIDDDTTATAIPRVFLKNSRAENGGSQCSNGNFFSGFKQCF